MQHAVADQQIEVLVHMDQRIAEQDAANGEGRQYDDDTGDQVLAAQARRGGRREGQDAGPSASLAADVAASSEALGEAPTRQVKRLAAW